MKRTSLKARNADVIRSLDNRKASKVQKNEKPSAIDERKSWLSREEDRGLNYQILDNKSIILTLPETMNFSHEYDTTVQYISAIRRLAGRQGVRSRAYSLGSVNFDNLLSISTSAALVLTAELSKWDDILNNKVVPITQNWNPNILQQFFELGFFDLFKNNPFQKTDLKENQSDVKLVKYIKGRCGDSKKSRDLRIQLRDVIGEDIDKWMFLRSGIDEAVTNVSHHAYPSYSGMNGIEKNWYLSGSYNSTTRELKIVFYDQGIGIPKSLPTTEFGERLLRYISTKFSFAEGMQHEIMLKAAIQLERTSTADSDRGKGLQDFLEFIKQRDNGYLSIISLKGLYKFTNKFGKFQEKSTSFNRAINGTLIIWSVTLD